MADNTYTADQAEEALMALDEQEVVEEEVELENEAPEFSDEEEFSEADESTAEDEGEDDPEEDHDEAEDATEEEPDLPAIDPPQFLDPKGREEFAELPRAAQEILQRRGTEMLADYTRKTMQTAETQKALDRRLQTMKEVVTEKEANARQWDNFKWTELAQKVSAEDYNRYRAQYEQDVGEYNRYQQAYSQAEQQKLQEHQQKQWQELGTVAPELTDPKKGKELLQDTWKYALDLGVSQERLQWATAQELAMFKDAKRYREQVSQRGKKPVLKSKPDAKAKAKPVRAGARAGSSNPQAKQIKRFKSNPSAKNAEALLMQMDD